MSGRGDGGSSSVTAPGAARTARAGRARGKRATPAPPPPLGSLLHPQATEDACPRCGDVRVTRIAMSLSDGTPVQFTSCRACEHQAWEHAGQDDAGRELAVSEVLERTRRTP